MSGLLMEQLHFVKGLDPVADGLAGTVSSDDVTPSNTSAVDFQSREIATGDTEAAITARAAAGYVGTAGSSKISLIEVQASALAASGYGYVRLQAVESGNDPGGTARS